MNIEEDDGPEDKWTRGLQKAEMTSWYYYLALKSKVLYLCHYKLSKACYVSQIIYNPSKLSPAYTGAKKKKPDFLEV